MSWFRSRQKAAPSARETPSAPAAEEPASSLRIDVTAAGIAIDDTLHTVLSVSGLSTVLGQPRIVPPADATPEDNGRIPNTMAYWDSAGVFAYTKGGDEVTELGIRLARDPDGEAKKRFGLAHQLFGGTLTIAGRPPLEAIPDAELRKAYLFLDASAGQWEATFFLNETECGELSRMEFSERLAKMETEELADIVRGAAHPFAWVSIGFRAPKVVKKSSGKWKHAATAEPEITLASFPFRLAVIQELMYEQHVLEPRFDVYDFAQDQGSRSFDPDEVGYEMIPSVRTWFRKLPIPARLAQRITTLVLDGGNDIYLQLIPQWDGEDDSFVIKTLKEEDLAPFTRLTTVKDIGGFLGSRARATLVKHGITVE